MTVEPLVVFIVAWALEASTRPRAVEAALMVSAGIVLNPDVDQRGNE